MAKRMLCVATLLLAGAASHADPAADEAYSRLNERMLAAKSAVGVLESDQPGRKVTYTFRLLRPNFYSVVSDKLEAHGDGKKEWLYMRKSRQYDAQAATKQMGPGAPLLGFEAMMQGRIPKDFVVGNLTEATIQGKQCQVIPLTARDDKTYRVRLYVDAVEGLPVGWQTDEPGPDPTGPPIRVTGLYTSLRLDAPLTPRSFAWAPPAGAKRIVQQDYTANLLKVGSLAPRFTLKTEEGSSVNLDRTVARNKATLVNFWFYG